MKAAATSPQGPDRDHVRKAYDGICAMLFHNEIGPGQKISYRDLSERLHMSQTPVIQALKWLEFQGLVRREPNRGYYTAPMSVREVGEIYDLRVLIETDLLRETIRTIDAKGLKTLEKALESHLKASRDTYLFDRLARDREFHLALAALSGKDVQLNVLGNLFDLLYLKYGARFLFSTPIDLADRDHKDLFARIEGRDFKGAKRVLSGHILRVKRHVLKSVETMVRAVNG